MHDPMAVSHEIRWPRWPWQPDGTYRPPILTIWHVDPERDGSDDSCDWFNRGKAEDKADQRRLAVREALWGMETLLDNRPHYPDSPEHKEFQRLKRAIRDALAPPKRRWFRHPRWHVHHWRFQFHPWQNLKRRWWDRCAVCGKRGFKGSAFGMGWDSRQIRHEHCQPKTIDAARGERGE